MDVRVESSLLLASRPKVSVRVTSGSLAVTLANSPIKISFVLDAVKTSFYCRRYGRSVIEVIRYSSGEIARVRVCRCTHRVCVCVRRSRGVKLRRRFAAADAAENLSRVPLVVALPPRRMFPVLNLRVIQDTLEFLFVNITVGKRTARFIASS